MATKKSSGAGTAVAGVALAAVAAAAAGAYFFGTKEGAKNRKVIGAWAKKAKTEVLKEMKKGKIVSKKAYHDAVSQVIARYKNANIDSKEIAATVAELKQHWVAIERDVKKHATALSKTKAAKDVTKVKKAVKKVVKKVSGK